MRKWLSIKLVKLATMLRPENPEAQEYMMKSANENWATRPGTEKVHTTWGKFKQDMESNRKFGEHTLVHGYRRCSKLKFTFASYHGQVTVFPDVTHKSPAQIYSDGNEAEMEDDYAPKK